MVIVVIKKNCTRVVFKVIDLYIAGDYHFEIIQITLGAYYLSKSDSEMLSIHIDNMGSPRLNP